MAETRKRRAVDKKALSRQIKDRNFLQPIGFQFQIDKAPAVTFFGNAVNVPGIELGVAEQPTYTKNIPLPGDMMQFGDLQLRFLVDENLENYQEIQKWMRALGFPESLDEIYEWQNKKQDIITPNRNKQLALYSDGTLNVLSNISIPKFRVVFQNMFPVSLSAIEFDAGVQDLEYVTAEVTFKYTIYKIEMIGKGACP
tara:strand:+ start:688 stop:1281 length:594 start_codon:yes stop_codon:yes gene_type:complete